MPPSPALFFANAAKIERYSILHFSLIIGCVLPSLFRPRYKCGKAQYSVDRLDTFVRNCAPKAWEDFFELDGVKDHIKLLTPIMLKDGKEYTIEPPMPLMFRALDMVDPDEVKVIILGQDPTPQAGKATGLAFSVNDPLSVGTVLNVLLEVALEGWSVSIFSGDLSKWAKQGVLLLNTALTVERDEAGSHIKLHWWTEFAQLLIEYISENAKPSVWLLWGNVAKGYKPLIDNKKHYVITGGHPSALGGIGTNEFIGGRYFQCANQFLSNRLRGRIDWGLAAKHFGLPVKNVMKPCPPEPKPLARKNPYKGKGLPRLGKKVKY
ncbi:uracil-DNA glycosylase-like [Oculina patagonica]